jgi:hypothetical protein
VISCEKDSNQAVAPDPYDHESQIPKDRDSISKYLNEHYFNEDTKSIWSIGSPGGATVQTPLSQDPKLETISGIEFNGTVSSYEMYYYEISEGIDDVGNIGFSSPSPVDSVFVKYSGMLLDSTVFDSKEDYPVWFQLPNTIEGWARGLTKFKRGSFKENTEENVEENDIIGDHKFLNPGKGYIIFPSGLGYKNSGSGIIPANSPLVFRIELDDVNLIDTDLDLVPTKFEINIDAAGNITTYNTDGDTKDDFDDVDDDNDFSLTKDEVLDEYVYILNEEGKLDTIYDTRGNVIFEYHANGNIVAKGTTDGIPNYKNPAEQ